MATIELMNVLTKSGKIAVGGEKLFGEELVNFCTAYIAKHGYSPRVVKSGETIEIEDPKPVVAPSPTDEIAVGKSIFTEMAEFIVRNHRAINPTVQYTDKDGNIYTNPYHWSGVVKLVLGGGVPQGRQLSYLNKQYALVETAVKIRRQRGQAYPLVDLDKLDWSF